MHIPNITKVPMKRKEQFTTSDPTMHLIIIIIFHCCCPGFLRGNLVAQDKFVEKDGYSLLLRAMQSEGNNKLRTKATFLMMGIMRDNEKHKSR